MVCRLVPFGYTAKGFVARIVVCFTPVRGIAVFRREDLQALALKRPMGFTGGLGPTRPLTSMRWQLRSVRGACKDEQLSLPPPEVSCPVKETVLGMIQTQRARQLPPRRRPEGDSGKRRGGVGVAGGGRSAILTSDRPPVHPHCDHELCSCVRCHINKV